MTTTATFADDTSILAVYPDPVIASQRLQSSLAQVQAWCQQWRVKINENKSTHVTFTLNRLTCPPVKFNDVELPQADEAKYLGLHLDRRLTWRSHIWVKRKQLGIKQRNMHWLLGSRSQLTLRNKLLLYKIILKPVWTYGIQLWGTASDSNIEILQRFQSTTLRMLVDAPWYVSNAILHQDLKMPTIEEEIRRSSANYQSRLERHPNHLAINLLDNSSAVKRLKRYSILDLSSRV